MPSTITSSDLPDLTGTSLAFAANVNSWFSSFRGHRIPIAPDTAAAADLTYYLGASGSSWSHIYARTWQAPTAGAFLLFDGVTTMAWQQNPVTTAGSNTGFGGFAHRTGNNVSLGAASLTALADSTMTISRLPQYMEVNLNCSINFNTTSQTGVKFYLYVDGSQAAGTSYRSWAINPAVQDSLTGSTYQSFCWFHQSTAKVTNSVYEIYYAITGAALTLGQMNTHAWGVR